MTQKEIHTTVDAIITMLKDLSVSYCLDVNLDELNISAFCYQTANELKLYTLQDLYRLSAAKLKERYSFDAGLLKELADNLLDVYKNPDVFLKKKSDKKDASKYPLDDILEGWNTAKVFNEAYLDSMTEWRSSRGFDPKRMLIDVDGIIYECDSFLEANLISELKVEKYFKQLRGQNLIIPYKKRRKGEESSYKPDLVLLSHDDHIVIIEVKPLYNIPTKRNVQKYNALSEYCKEKGYLYCICDDKFRTLKDLKEYEIDKSIEKFVLYHSSAYDAFNYNDFKTLKSRYRKYGEEYIKENIAAIVVQNDLDFSGGDLAGNIRKLRISIKD